MDHQATQSGTDSPVLAAKPGTGPLSLFIGVPTYGKSDQLFAIDSGWELLWHIGRHHPEIGRIWIQRDVRTYRQEARKQIVYKALNVGSTHILMLDDDHHFTGPDFTKIWRSMLEDPFHRHLVGALYFTRNDNPAPAIFKSTVQGTVPYFYYPEDTLMEVDVIGFGFQLFQTAVFKKVNEPWFDLGQGVGEDAAFCMRWRHGGGKIWCHTGVKIGHIMETPRIVGEAEYLVLRKLAEEYSHERLETHSLLPTGEEPMVSGVVRQVRSRPWWRPGTSRHRSPEPSA